MVNLALVIIVASLIVLGLVFIRLKGINSKFWLILLALCLLFLFGTMSFVVSKNEINLNEKEGIFKALKLYAALLGNGFHNLKSLAGNAIDMNWTETDKSFFNKSEIKPTRK